jgi:LacI family transcriptional regulator
VPTIKKVAERAGVSVGTVSHVINASVPVSEELRLRVQAAIRELNYHPNHVARSLKTSKTRILGIIVPDLTISFFPQVIRGAETQAREHGYSLVAVNSTDDCERQKELLSLLHSQRVEGILLVVASGPSPIAQMSRIREARIPVVCLDRVPDRVPVDSVSVEDETAAQMGVEHLIARGYRRIAVVTGPMALKNERRRLVGYKQALKGAGIEAGEDLVWNGNLRPEDVAALCAERLRATGPPPEAIFSTNGPTALGVLRAFRDCGLRTPEDIGFATFDEITVDDVFRPAVTTVVQPAREIGYRAAEILLRRIAGDTGLDSSGPITIRLPATLKVRETSKARSATA